MRLFKKGILGAAVIAGCSACSDTIDEHYAVSDGVASKTLWEQIKADPNLSDFAEVLEKVHYYSNETKSSGLTYKDILQQNMKMTVWAPVNGSFDKNKYLNEIKTNEYSVDHRFVRNHINTFARNISGNENDSITMLNSKMSVLSNADKTFKGVEVVQSNIPATNGVLHTLAHDVEFLDNLYEYMQITPNVSSLYQYFKDRDTTYIDEYQSVPGGIDEDGEITWADEVWKTESKAFNYSFQYRGETWDGIFANLKDEDSTFVMVMPTNTGWNKAIAKTYPYYKYMSFPYANKDDKNAQPETINPDTLQKYQSMMSIVNRLVFSPNRQKGYTLEDFGNTDSLFTTRGEVIDTPYCNDIFRDIEPIRLSNGYAYLTDDYRYNVVSDIEFEGETSLFQYMTDIVSSRLGVATVYQQNPKIPGSVSDKSYVYTIEKVSNTPTEIAFKLPNILSTTYDIKVVIVPENISIADTAKTALPLQFTAELAYYDGTSALEVSPAPETEDKLSDPTKVDTIPLFTDFHFPVAYKGVSGAYPILKLKVKSSRGLGTKFSNRICVDKIILVAKDKE